MANQNHSEKYDQNIIAALKKINSPIYDSRHDLKIYLIDEKSRSNESRFEHIARKDHRLSVKDIEYLENGIKISKLKKDKLRRKVYNYYIKRKNGEGYIKISVDEIKDEQRAVKVKTIFITREMK